MFSANTSAVVVHDADLSQKCVAHGDTRQVACLPFEVAVTVTAEPPPFFLALAVKLGVTPVASVTDEYEVLLATVVQPLVRLAMALEPPIWGEKPIVTAAPLAGLP